MDPTILLICTHIIAACVGSTLTAFYVAAREVGRP